MATRIVRIDDLDGSDGAEVFTFSLDNVRFEIDLCARNRARFLGAIRPFAERARPIVADGESEAAGSSVSREPTRKVGRVREEAPTNLVDDQESEASRGLDLVEMARNLGA